jgi:prolipoprotein diacylglyceryltransferase
MNATLELSFDPMLAMGGVSLRWDALALVVVLVISIGVWVLRLRAELGDALRFEDVWFVLLAAIPGAVVGGRLLHVLDYADSYLAAPLTTLDLGHGSSSLVGAVIGGALSAAYICRLLGGSIGLWADAAAVPILLAIGLGKLAIMLGGAGQGLASDGPVAVSFTGAGPWRSIDAGDPAWPSQALEGLWALLGIPVVLALERLVARKGRAGRGIVLLVGLAWWLAGRAAVALTWKDDRILGPWGPEATVTLVALGVTLVALALTWRTPAVDGSPEPTGPHQTASGGPGPIGTAGR